MNDDDAKPLMIVKGRCVCGGHFEFIVTGPKDPSTPDAVLCMHTRPTCDLYDRNTVGAYLAMMRAHAQRACAAMRAPSDATAHVRARRDPPN